MINKIKVAISAISILKPFMLEKCEICFYEWKDCVINYFETYLYKMERKNRLSGYIPQLNRSFVVNDSVLLTEEGIRRLRDVKEVDGSAEDHELFTKDIRLNTLIRRQQIMGMRRAELLKYKKEIIERYGF